MPDYPATPKVSEKTVMVVVVDQEISPLDGKASYVVMFYQQVQDPDAVDITLRALYEQLDRMFAKKGN